MIEGESGLLAISPPWDYPKYEPSKTRLTWKNGARALLLSADEPERFRGKQADTVWADELATWRYPEAWDQLMLGFRLGGAYGVTPRGFVSTTPRPAPILTGDGKGDRPLGLMHNPTVRVVRGTTYDNRANLSNEYFADIISKYEGTRLGRQELNAEILDDLLGALWTRAVIEAKRVRVCPDELARVVVAIDPAVSANPGSDETGIVVVGLGYDDRGYVLADYTGKMTPNEWAQRAVAAYYEFGADRIIAEVNNGGDLVEINIRTVDRNVPYRGVHAAHGKRTRAEPIAALYEQGRVSHVGVLDDLEGQMCGWLPLPNVKSPDRMDALVWGLSELMLKPTSTAGMATRPLGGF